MEFKRKQVEKIIGMTPARIRLYGDRGLLTLGEQFPGHGNERVYTWVNLLELAIIHEFSKHGLELKAINRILTFVRKGWPEILQKNSYIGDRPKYYIISYGKENDYDKVSVTVKGTRLNETISDFLLDTQSAVIVDVTKVVSLLP